MHFKHLASAGTKQNGETLFTTWAAGARGQHNRRKASKSICNFKQSNGELHCTNNISAVADMDDRLATIDMGRKLGGLYPL